MVRASEALQYDFIDINICHHMEPLQILHFMTLTFIFDIKHFLVMYWLSKNLQAVDVPSRFASTDTTMTLELLLFIIAAANARWRNNMQLL